METLRVLLLFRHVTQARKLIESSRLQSLERHAGRAKERQKAVSKLFQLYSENKMLATLLCKNYLLHGLLRGYGNVKVSWGN